MSTSQVSSNIPYTLSNVATLQRIFALLNADSSKSSLYVIPFSLAGRFRPPNPFAESCLPHLMNNFSAQLCLYILDTFQRLGNSYPFAGVAGRNITLHRFKYKQARIRGLVVRGMVLPSKYSLRRSRYTRLALDRHPDRVYRYQITRRDILFLHRVINSRSITQFCFVLAAQCLRTGWRRYGKETEDER